MLTYAAACASWNPIICSFQPSIRDILSRIPPKHTRQTLLFSATVPGKVKEVSKIALKDAYQCVTLHQRGHELPACGVMHALTPSAVL